jgi:hypothetical protein
VKNVRRTKIDPSSRLENQIKRDSFECLCVDARIIANWILNMMGGCGVDSSGPGMDPVLTTKAYIPFKA